MSLERKSVITVFSIIYIILPCVIIGNLIFTNPKSVLVYLTNIIIFLEYFVILYYTGYWGAINYKIKYLFVTIGLLVILRETKEITTLTTLYQVTDMSNLFFMFRIILFLILGVNIIFIFKSFSYKGKDVKLEFPFKDGEYWIMHGGDGKHSSLTNYHYNAFFHRRAGVNDSMRYAVDIVKLSRGKISKHIFSTNILDYESFQDKIYAPCDGKVVDIIEEYDNSAPYGGNYPYNTGNTIIIKTKDYYVLMGHIQKGSIRVRLSEYVAKGDEIARVGNSGMTQFPHLHMQVVSSDSEYMWFGKGIPILFNNKFPVKNMIFKV